MALLKISRNILFLAPETYFSFCGFHAIVLNLPKYPILSARNVIHFCDFQYVRKYVIAYRTLRTCYAPGTTQRGTKLQMNYDMWTCPFIAHYHMYLQWLNI